MGGIHGARGELMHKLAALTLEDRVHLVGLSRLNPVMADEDAEEPLHVHSASVPPPGDAPRAGPVFGNDP